MPRSSSHQNGLLAGRKLRGRHTTTIEAARPVLAALKRLPGVSKIIVGEIKPCRCGSGSLAFKPIAGGLLVLVRSTRQIQRLYVHAEDADEVQQKLGGLR